MCVVNPPVSWPWCPSASVSCLPKNTLQRLKSITNARGRRWTAGQGALEEGGVGHIDLQTLSLASPSRRWARFTSHGVIVGALPGEICGKAGKGRRVYGIEG